MGGRLPASGPAQVPNVGRAPLGIVPSGGAVAAQELARLGETINEQLQARADEQLKRDGVKAAVTLQSELNEFRTRAIQVQDPAELDRMLAEELPKLAQRGQTIFPFGGEEFALQAQQMVERTGASLVGHQVAVRRQDAQATAGLIADAFAEEVSAYGVADADLQADAIEQMRVGYENLDAFTPAEKQALIARAGRAGALSFMDRQIEEEPQALLRQLEGEDVQERLAADPLLSHLDPSDVPKIREAAQGALIDLRAKDISDLEIGVARGQRGYADIERFFEQKLISGPKRTELILKADSVWKSGLAAQQTEEKERLKRFAEWRISELELAIDRGEAGEFEIEQFYKRGSIDADRRTRYMKRAAKVQAEALERAAAENEVAEALMGVRTLDPRDSRQRGAADRMYVERLLPVIQEEPEQAASVSADFARRVGIVPEAMQGVIRGSLRAGDAQGVVQASNLLGLLEAQNPALLRDFAEPDILLGKHVSALVASGVPAERAVQIARDAQSQAASLREERERRYVALDMTASNVDALEDLTDTWGLDPPLSDAMVGEFEALVRDLFLQSGDEDASREAAWAHLKTVWRRTDVNGSEQWMKYPPELYYAPGAGTEWFREQLSEELGVPAEELAIYPDMLTGREAKHGAPSYVVQRRNEQGMFEPVLDANGEPLDTFRPDYATSPAGRREAEEREKAVKEAKADKVRGQSEELRRQEAALRFLGLQ